MYKITVVGSFGSDFSVSTKEEVAAIRKEYKSYGAKIKATKVSLFK